MQLTYVGTTTKILPPTPTYALHFHAGEGLFVHGAQTRKVTSLTPVMQFTNGGVGNVWPWGYCHAMSSCVCQVTVLN
jgi:hypothetical protein